MNKNIKLLYVKNNETQIDHALEAAIDALPVHKVIKVVGAKAALNEFVTAKGTQPFDVTLISDFPNKDELKLLNSLLEIDPDQYIVMLYNDIDAEKVLNSVRHGASGILNRPYSPEKFHLELDKFSLLREDKIA